MLKLGARWTRPSWPTKQVIAGKCERCGAEVVRRMLNQWYFKITEYAVLTGCSRTRSSCRAKWPYRVPLMQRNWIGRVEGAEVHFTATPR